MATREDWNPYDPLTWDLPTDEPGITGGLESGIVYGRSTHGVGFGPQNANLPSFGVYGMPRIYGPPTDPPMSLVGGLGQIGGGVRYGASRSVRSSPTDYGGLADATLPAVLDPIEEELFERRIDALMAQRASRVPRSYTRSDERIRDDVAERLYNRPHLDTSDVRLDVRDGVVAMEGTVGDRRTKYEIENVAASARGVKDVDNMIRVARPTPGAS